MTPERIPEPLVVILFATMLFDSIGVAYLIGGSFASSLHGEPRSTNDVDIVVDMASEHVDPLLAASGTECYVSETAVREAVATGGSFNMVHRSTAMKIDVFVVGGDPFDRERLRQRGRVEIPLDPQRELSVFVDTPENTVLRKLEWFRRGGESSERQWQDVIAILKTNPQLDDKHLVTWAERLEVSDLLTRAQVEARN